MEKIYQASNGSFYSNLGYDDTNLLFLDFVLPEELFIHLDESKQLAVKELRSLYYNVIKNIASNSERDIQLSNYLLIIKQIVPPTIFSKVNETELYKKINDQPKISSSLNKYKDLNIAWNPHPKEQLFNITIDKSDIKNYKVVATVNIPANSKVYIGNPMSTILFNSNEDYAKWTFQIMDQKNKGIFEELYPREEIEFLGNVSNISKQIYLNYFDNGKYKEIYYVGSFFNHSCAPNALQLIKKHQMWVISINDIKKGDEIKINYLDISCDNPKIRQEKLKSSDGFQCNCISCIENGPQPFDVAMDKIIQNGNTAIIPKYCFWCSKKANKKCSVCQIARYCSVECHMDHWKFNHKKQCEAWKNIAQK
jgi:hypothetical protein